MATHTDDLDQHEPGPVCGKILVLGFGALRCSNSKNLCERCGYCQDKKGWNALTGKPNSKTQHCECTLMDILTAP